MNCWKKIGAPVRFAFCGTLLFGLISQGMGLFNKFSVRDDIDAMFGVGATYKSGRWMLGLLEEIYRFVFGSSPSSLPLTGGLAALLLLACTACLFVRLLDIRHPLIAGLTGALWASFPALTGLFGYMFTLPYYMIGLMMAAGGLYLICRGKNWGIRLPGILLTACSLGVYQAFFPAALCGALLYVIQDADQSREKPARLFGHAAWIAGALILSLVLYFALNQLALNATQTKLTSYQDINQMGKESVSEYLSRAGLAYSLFLSPETLPDSRMYPLNTLYIYKAVMGIAALLSLRMVIQKSRESVFTAGMMLACILLIPPAANAIFIMSEPTKVHNLMPWGQMLPLLYFAWLTDRLSFRKAKIRRGCKAFLASLLAVLNLMYCQYDNQCYLKAELTQQQAISYFTTLVTRIKSAEGYRDEYPVYVVGDWEDDLSIREIEELAHVNEYPYFNLHSYISGYHWKKYMQYWCGYAPRWKKGEKVRELPEVIDMDIYPDDGSILVLDGKVIIKFR